MTNLWIKHIWKACKIFAYFLIATYLKSFVKRHMIIIYKKYPTSSNWYFSMTFTDFQWLCQAKCHFSRPTSNSMTFQGKIEIPWLFQACMNHADKYIIDRCILLTKHVFGGKSMCRDIKTHHFVLLKFSWIIRTQHFVLMEFSWLSLPFVLYMDQTNVITPHELTQTWCLWPSNRIMIAYSFVVAKH